MPDSLLEADWPALLDRVRALPGIEPLLRTIPDEDLRLLLKAPVAVAWWIERFAPELAQRDTLDLLVVGLPGGPSSADAGRPYQLIPYLLRRPALAVTTTVLVAAPDAPLAPPVAYATPTMTLAESGEDRPATLFGGSLVEWWESRQGDPPDVALIVHPRFDQRAGFWEGVRLLLEAGVPVGCFARGFEETERDTWLLQAYGYEIEGQAAKNPWARYRPQLLGHGAWAAIGWRLTPRAIPAAGHPVDTARLARSRDAQRLLQHEYEVWNPLRFIGRVQVDTSDERDPERFVGLPEHHLLSLSSGEVFALEPEGRVPVFGRVRIPAEILRTFPADAASDYARLLWAVEVYRDEFAPREATAASEQHDADVRGIHDELARALKGAPSAEEIAAFARYYVGGGDPTVVTAGAEPLFEALRRRDWERAAAMVAGSPELVWAQDEDGRTPLFYAMSATHLDLARRWLEVGASPDHLDHEGFAVIHDAAKRDDPAPIELLARYGADLDLPTGLGFTPALLALRYGCWSVLGYLVAHDIDLNRGALAGSSVAEQYANVPDLPRVLRAEIDRRLGKRSVIPIVPVGAARSPTSADRR